MKCNGKYRTGIGRNRRIVACDRQWNCKEFSFRRGSVIYDECKFKPLMENKET